MSEMLVAGRLSRREIAEAQERVEVKRSQKTAVNRILERIDSRLNDLSASAAQIIKEAMQAHESNDWEREQRLTEHRTRVGFIQDELVDLKHWIRKECVNTIL